MPAADATPTTVRMIPACHLPGVNKAESGYTIRRKRGIA